MKNFYEILGLPEEATNKQIDKAFCRKMMKYQARNNKEEIKKLREAYFSLLEARKNNTKNQKDNYSKESSEEKRTCEGTASCPKEKSRNMKKAKLEKSKEKLEKLEKKNKENFLDDSFSLLDKYFAEKFKKFNSFWSNFGLEQMFDVKFPDFSNISEEMDSSLKRIKNDFQKSRMQIEEIPNEQNDSSENNHIHSFSSFQHIFNDGDKSYMKSFSESSKRINGHYTSESRTVEKKNGENIIFERKEDPSGRVETKKYKVSDEEFEKEFFKNLENKHPKKLKNDYALSN